MDIRKGLASCYYENTISDLRRLSRKTQEELSYNSMIYLEVIAFLEEQRGCTVTGLARALHVSVPAATMKVNGLQQQGLVRKVRGESDKRVSYLTCTDQVKDIFQAYDRPFERACRRVEREFSVEEQELFCRILQVFTEEYTKDKDG